MFVTSWHAQINTASATLCLIQALLLTAVAPCTVCLLLYLSQATRLQVLLLKNLSINSGQRTLICVYANFVATGLWCQPVKTIKAAHELRFQG